MPHFRLINNIYFYGFQLLIGVVLIYYPGLTGSFLFDDEANLLNNPGFIMEDHHWRSLMSATFSGHAGPLQRPVSMFTFALNQMFDPSFNPYYYKLTNVVIHAINAILVMLFTQKILRQWQEQGDINIGAPLPGVTTLSAIIAAIWAFHPLALTSVLYIVQRMTSLSATFSILACIAYCVGRQQMLRGKRWQGALTIVVLSGLATLLAMYSKESALVTPGLWLMIELSVFRWRKFGTSQGAALIDSAPESNSDSASNSEPAPESASASAFESKSNSESLHESQSESTSEAVAFSYGNALRWLKSPQMDRPLLAVWVGLIVSAVVVLLVAYPLSQILGGYNGRSFTVGERLLSEARIVWFYVSLIVFPQVQHLGFYHDDMAISSGWLTPWTTLPAVLAWGGVIALLLWPKLWRRWPYLALGFSWFVLGHLLESTIWPLELAHEHRNYLPMYGIILSFCLAGMSYLRASGNRRLFVGFFAMLIVVPAILTGLRAEQWGNESLRSTMEALRHPHSPRAHYDAARMYLQRFVDTNERRFYDAAMKELRQSNSLDRPGMEYGCLAELYLPYVVGEKHSPSVLDWCVQRLRQSPAFSVNLNQVEFLARMQRKTMAMPDEDFLRLPRALLENPRIDPNGAARAYSLMGSYASNKMNDYETAGKLIYQATQIDQHDRNIAATWVSYLIATNQFDAARRQINSLKQAPDAWKHAVLIDKLEKRLDSETKQVTK